MKRIAFVQADTRGRAYSANGAKAAQGFGSLGYEVRDFFDAADLDRQAFDASTPVVGGTGTIRGAVERLTGHPPPPLALPATLAAYLGREVVLETLAEVAKRGRFPRFVKPFEVPKAFPAQLVHSAAEVLALSAPREGFPPLAEDFVVSVQDPVRLVSEWRVFVVREAVVGTSHYIGDALCFPNPTIVRLAVGAYAGAPAGYAADFGVDDAGRTVLVEVNDGYALGSGGLPADLYARLLEARWQEMCLSR